MLCVLRDISFLLFIFISFPPLDSIVLASWGSGRMNEMNLAVFIVTFTNTSFRNVCSSWHMLWILRVYYRLSSCL